MKQFLGILLTCLTVFIGYTQQKIETINGKKYFVHTVEKKQTLYGIHKQYNVSIEDISNANQDLDGGLKVGQQILVPISLSNKKYYQQHVIAKGETLYAISKKYNCSVSDLKSLNPELIDLDIQIGQVITVPSMGLVKTKTPKDALIEDVAKDEKIYKEDLAKTSISREDTIVKHTVLEHETLYSIAKRYMVTPDDIRKRNALSINNLHVGDVIMVPVKKVNYEFYQGKVDSSFIYSPFDSNTEADIVRKPIYKVALLIPLMYVKNKSVMNRPLKIGEIEKLNPITKAASDFYFGFKMAADSIAKAGLNAEIYIYDTENDTSVIQSIFNSNDFTNIDMVVGPFFQNTINFVAQYCKTNKIPMIIPVNSNNSVLYQNPYVLKTNGSVMSQVDGMVDFLVKDYSAYNICIVKPTKEEDKELYNRARDRYNNALKREAFTPNIIEINLGSSSGRDWNYKLRKDTVNIIVVPSNDVKFVTSVFTRVNNVLNTNVYAKGMRVVVFGLEDWNRIDDIDMKHRIRTQQHFSSYKFLDFNSTQTIQFIKNFRSLYGNEPGSASFQGFDVGFYFLSAMYLYGENYMNFLKQHQIDLIQNNFNFTSVSEGSGKENTATCVAKYQNYSLEFISW